MPALARRCKRPPRGGSEDGIALVFVLLLVMLVSLLATAFSTEARTGGQLVINRIEVMKARWLAQGAVEKGLYELLSADRQGTWKRDGTVYSWTEDEQMLTGSVQDERGKLDLNHASPEVLRQLLRQVIEHDVEGAAISDAIIDWRDEDDLRRLEGAESPDYLARGRAFGPANRAFRSVSELQQVISIDSRLFERLRKLLTVYGTDQAVNPRYASRAVLFAIPELENVEVEAFLSARDAEPTEPFRASLPNLTGGGQRVTGKSGPVYSIRGAARLESGTAMELGVVVWLDTGGKSRVLEVWEPPIQADSIEAP